MAGKTMTIAVTGANSSVGLNLLEHLAGRNDLDVVACVRSDGAAASLPDSPRQRVHVVPYEDGAGLAKALTGAQCVVHLAGILIEWKGTNYESANVSTTSAVAKAASEAGVEHIVLVSVVGASAESPNRYFRSKGQAERAVASSGIPATIVRTPILLGPDTAGASALVRTVRMGKAKLLGGGRYTMRPLDVDDLSGAILAICGSRPEGVAVHELVGPQPITYRALVELAAETAGKDVTIGSTPIWVAKVGTAIGRGLKRGGLSPTVIDVITMDEVVEKNADGALGIALTPLSETLRKIFPQTERVP